jgi:hypothetical protein
MNVTRRRDDQAGWLIEAQTPPTLREDRGAVQGGADTVRVNAGPLRPMLHPAKALARTTWLTCSPERQQTVS